MKSSDWNLSESFGILLDEFVSDLWIWVIDMYAQCYFINHNRMEVQSIPDWREVEGLSQYLVVS